MTLTQTAKIFFKKVENFQTATSWYASTSFTTQITTFSPSKNTFCTPLFSGPPSKNKGKSQKLTPNPRQNIFLKKLLILRRLEQRIVLWPPNHLMQRRTRRNHRIHSILFLHLEIHQKRLAAIPSLRHSRNNIFALTNMRAINPMRRRQLHKVRRKNRRSSIVLFIKRLLPLPHHPPEKPLLITAILIASFSCTIVESSDAVI